MNDPGLGDIWTLVRPRFGDIVGGGVEAVTPILVLVIWAVALFVGGFAWREAHRAKRLVAEATRLIDDVEPGHLGNRRSEIADRAGASSEVISAAWRDFDETLVREGRDVFNTVDAAEYFNEHRFAPRLVGNRFLHAAPTALTTLGLLGTFLGLTVGLTGLDLGSTSDELRTGVQTLVDGAALGFMASLWGVFASLVTNVLERWLERGVVRDIRILQGKVDRLFPMRSPEQSLSDIATHSSESTAALQVLHEKIGGALQESVQSIGSNTSRAVTEAIHASLTPAMTELSKHAANQSADVFREISGELTASFREIGVSLAGELKSSADSMRATLDYMGEQLSRHADEHLTRLGALEEATVSQLRAVNEASERQLLLLDESLPRIVTGLEQAASLVGSATIGMEAVTSSLTRASSGLDETSETLGRMLADAIGTMDELAGRSTTAAQSLADQQGAVTDLMGKAIAAVELLRDVSSALSGGFDGMRASQSAFLDGLRRQLDGHVQAMSESFSEYGALVQTQTAHRMSEWNAHTDQFTSMMMTATHSLSDAIDELGERRSVDDTKAAA